MEQAQSTKSNDKINIVVLCETCSQKLRIPKRSKRLRVTCPTCKHEFNYKHYGFGFSSNSKKPLLTGLVGSLVGFLVVEVIYASKFLATTGTLFQTIVITGALGMCLSAVMGAAEGLFRKNKSRLYYGLKAGAILGVIAGVIARAIAPVSYTHLTLPTNREV